MTLEKHKKTKQNKKQIHFDSAAYCTQLTIIVGGILLHCLQTVQCIVQIGHCHQILVLVPHAQSACSYDLVLSDNLFTAFISGAQCHQTILLGLRVPSNCNFAPFQFAVCTVCAAFAVCLCCLCSVLSVQTVCTADKTGMRLNAPDTTYNVWMHSQLETRVRLTL